jgi:hypothetical protein
MGYRLDGQGSIPSRSKRFFFAPQHLDQLWGPPNPLCNGYMVIFSTVWSRPLTPL